MTIRRIFTGKNVQEATAVALETLDAELEDVDIRVLNPGRAGIFGLGGALAEIEVAKLSDVLAEEAREVEERQQQMDEATGVAEPERPRPQRQRRQTERQQPERRQRQTRPRRQEQDTQRDEQDHEEPRQRRERQRPQPRRNRQTSTNRQRSQRNPDQRERQSRRQEVETRGRSGDVETSAPAAIVRERRPEPQTEPIQDRSELETVTGEILSYLISTMSVDVEAYVLDELRDGSVVFEIEGEDSGLLIGRRGETLRDVQFIVRMLVNRRIEQRANIIIDVERYQLRRTQKLHTIAESAARSASRGRAKSLDPMTPEERRIVHMALSDNAQVVTESEGQGSERHVVVKPR